MPTIRYRQLTIADVANATGAAPSGITISEEADSMEITTPRLSVSQRAALKTLLAQHGYVEE